MAEALEEGGTQRLSQGHEATLLSIIGDWLPEAARVPVLICGAAGAREGWAEAGYAAVPAKPATPAKAVVAPTTDPRIAVRILPGLSQAKPPDTMRGEETQIAGFLAEQPEFDGVLCLPGTETKWAQISAGEVVSFRTYLTGSLYEHLAQRSVLRHGIAVDGWDEAAFAEAVGDAMSRPQGVAAALGSLRGAWVLEGAPPEAAHARLSGLLIGLELAGARPYWLGQTIAVIGDGRVAQAYTDALSAQGCAVSRVSGQAASLAGLRQAAGALGMA